MTSMILWAYTIGSALMFILCDSLAANWGKTKDWTSLIIVFLLGPIAYIVFGLLNQSKSLAILNSQTKCNTSVVRTCCDGNRLWASPA